MEEIREKRPRIKVPKMPKNKQSLSVLISPTIRGLIRDANDLELTKENIISLMKEGGQFILIYFK